MIISKRKEEKRTPGRGRIPFMLVIVVVCTLISGCAAVSKTQTPMEEVRLMIVSDLHYLSGQLHDEGPRFTRLVKEADGKITDHSEALLEALIEEVRRQQPDALILSGDLTLNGARESHEELAAQLKSLQETGIKILVIPGNHDLNNSSAARFSGSQAIRTESVSAEAFDSLYAVRNQPWVLSQDPDSLSYMCELSPSLRILMLDANTEENPGRISENTLEWMADPLEQAFSASAVVLSVTHQNLVDHTRLFSNGMTIGNAKAVRQLLSAAGVQVNFSGHMHIQHIAEAEGLLDVATSSLAVAPLHYGMVTISDQGELEYEARSLPETELQQAALSLFEETTRNQVAVQLEKLEWEPDDLQPLQELAVHINNRIFDGTLPVYRSEFLKDPAWAQWTQAGSSLFFGHYMESMLEEADRDNTQVHLKLSPGLSQTDKH